MKNIIFNWVLFLCGSFLFGQEPILPWVVYYNDKADSQTFNPYNPIVLDSEHHPDLSPLIAQKKVILGYLNAAEAEDRHAWFKSIKDENILIEENPHWKGSWSVDIRNPVWKNFILNQAVPNILSQGFNGVFLDQMDIALYLEKMNPQKFKGMKEASIDLIKAIRHQYPNIYLMLNRGYEILPEIGGVIDFELGETLYTNYDFGTKEYKIRPKNEFEWQLEQMNRAKFVYPKLVLFSLDYWDPKDQEMYRQIYSIERQHGLRPYVSTPKLDEVYPEPASKSP